MRNILLGSFLIVSMFFLFYCNNNKSKIKSESSENTRNAYVKKLKSQLDQWNMDLDKLDTDTKKLKGDIRVKADQQLSAIRIQQDELKRNIEKIQNSTDNSWDDLKQGAEEARQKIVEAFSQAQAEFK